MSEYSSPPSSPVRTKSAPPALWSATKVEAVSPPALPPAPDSTFYRTMDNQGPPDNNLGVPDDDITDPNAYRTLDWLIERLLAPPRASYSPKNAFGEVMDHLVVIRMQWVMKTVSEKHFIYDPSKGRSVLRNDSKLRTHGLAYGLPARYHAFLCGELEEAGTAQATKDSVWIWKKDFVKGA